MRTVMDLLALKQYRLGKKFLTISILIVIPLSLLGYFFTAEKFATIHVTQNEIRGIGHVGPVKELIRHLQQHRGSSATYLGGKTEFKQKMLDLQNKIATDVTAIEMQNDSTRSYYAVDEEWKVITGRWSELKGSVFGLQAPESFAKHTELINSCMSLITTIADRSSLTFDPNSLTFYLMDVATSKSIFVTEYLGRLRAKGSNAIVKNDVTIQTKSQVISLMSVSKESLEKMFAEMEKIYSTELAIKDRMISVEKNAKSSTDAYYRLAQEGIVNAQDIQMDPKTYFDQATAAIDNIFLVCDVTSAELVKALRSRERLLMNELAIVVSICGAAILLLGVVFFSIVRNIRKNVSHIVEELQEFASGNTCVRVSVDSKDEMGELAISFNRMATDINVTLVRVSESSAAVASASTQISSSTEEMAAGSQEQSSQAGEVVEKVRLMTQTITANANNAGDAVRIATLAKETAQSGGDVVQRTVTEMKSISDVVYRSANTVKALGESSNQIGEIVSVIDDIADQTNLLALNAAIEAARAGDQGRGFAVVADEVRRLAERTTKATKEIAVMIKQIQNDTKLAVISMDEGTKKVVDGITLADKAGSSLQEIVAISQQVADKVSQIAEASRQQSLDSELISKNVESIGAVTQESASATHQIAKTAEDLNHLTENLQSILSAFKLNDDAVGGPVHTSAVKHKVVKRSKEHLLQHEMA